MAGRPKLLDDDLIESWCEAIATGLTPRLVCYRIGINYGQSCTWLQRGNSDLEEGVDSVEARFARRHAGAREARSGRWLQVLEDVAQGAEKDSDRRGAATWLLEHCEPEEFGAKSKVEVTGKDGGAVQVQSFVAVVPPRLSPEEWAKQYAPAKANDGDAG